MVTITCLKTHTASYKNVAHVSFWQYRPMVYGDDARYLCSSSNCPTFTPKVAELVVKLVKIINRNRQIYIKLESSFWIVRPRNDVECIEEDTV